MDAETRSELADIKTMIEEIHAAIIAGETLSIRKPGRLTIKLAARKMLEQQKQPLRLVNVAGKQRRVL